MAARLVLVGALVLGLSGVIPLWLMWSLVGGAAVVALADFLLTLWVRQRSSVPAGPEAFIGRTAVARTPLDPDGFIVIDGERWQAHIETGHADEGDEVAVVGSDGLCLQVRRAAWQPHRGAGRQQDR